LRATLQVHDVGGFKVSAVLSVPSDGRFESYFLKDAKKLGIKSDELNTQEGFVNIHREIGEVILDIDGKVDKYRVKQNGDYLELPQYGDQKFLFSGILSNDTKILRQLRNTDEDNEPDDFKWAVTLLSNAKNYDEIASHLKEEKETFLRIKLDAESAIKRSEKIRKELGELKQDLSQVEKSLLELEPKFKGTTKPLQDRKKIIDDIETATKQINQKENELKQKLHEKEQFERQLQQFKKQIKENEEALDNLELFGKRIKNEKEVDLGYLKREIISSINDETY
jgi:DNA repair exonuclease SbcCD ATPase subunit